jgi:hypothetical protein
MSLCRGTTYNIEVACGAVRDRRGSARGSAARAVPRTTVNGWYRNRTRTGHPEKAGRIGLTDYWYEDEWTAWHDRYVRGKIASLTEIDRDGDPDDLFDAAGAARILRYKNHDVVHANRHLGYFPEPDAYGTARNGRPAPPWNRRGTPARGPQDASSARQRTSFRPDEPRFPVFRLI